MSDEERRKRCRRFLTKGRERKAPTRSEFTAYGQACRAAAAGTFELLRDHDARLVASAIPRDVVKPTTEEANEFLGKDHVFLLERYFVLLEEPQEHGPLVMDEIDKGYDRRFVRSLEAYFKRTETGRYRSAWIVPTPFFVSSEMTDPVQAADLAIDCVNRGYRLPARGMNAPVRPEIAADYGRWLSSLRFRGQADRNGTVHDLYGIVFVPDPYSPRRDTD